MANSWAHRWPVVATLSFRLIDGGTGVNGGGHGASLHGPGQYSYVDTGIVCTSPAHPHPPPARPPAHPHPPPARPPATPGHPLRTCVFSRYARPETPWHDWLSRAPLDTAGGGWTQQAPQGPAKGSAGPPRGGVSDARRVSVTHSHFWTKIVTFLHPNSPHCPFTFLDQNSHPNSPQLHLRRTPG